MALGQKNEEKLQAQSVVFPSTLVLFTGLLIFEFCLQFILFFNFLLYIKNFSHVVASVARLSHFGHRASVKSLQLNL